MGSIVLTSHRDEKPRTQVRQHLRLKSRLCVSWEGSVQDVGAAEVEGTTPTGVGERRLPAGTARDEAWVGS